MAVEQNMVCQLVKRLAGLKETGVRCDVEAGMAKLAAARGAWSAADNALQVHGGNGYALEYPISRVSAAAWRTGCVQLHGYSRCRLRRAGFP